MNERRGVDRVALDAEVSVFKELFDGYRSLNARYSRAVRWMTAAIIVGIFVSAIEGALIYHTLSQQGHDRARARIALARATRRVAVISCGHQNEHRAVEREILRRNLHSLKRFQRSAFLSRAEYLHQRHELLRDIHALRGVNCQVTGEIIPQSPN